MSSEKQVIANRKEIEENYRLCIDTITDDREYRRQLEDLNNGCGEVQTLIRSLLMAYSKNNTEEDISEKLKEYEDRLDTMALLKQDLDMKIAACSAKRVQITGFLIELMKHDAPLAKFDPLVWQAVINYATVNRDCTITFTFRDGTEKTVPIKNGVRPYTNRNKPQEVDGNDGWVTDISYIQTGQGVLYLSIIRDLFDNSIVAYKTGTSQTVNLVLDTIRLAMQKEKKVAAELQLHSDQGSQYTSQAYFDLAIEYGITPSMSKRGNYYDNAMAENFFSILKTECIYRHQAATFEEANILIDNYIFFYNHQRIQLKTGVAPLTLRHSA